MRIGRTLRSRLILIIVLLLVAEVCISTIQTIQFNKLDRATTLLQTRYEVASDDTAQLRENVLRFIARVETVWVRDKQTDPLDALVASADETWQEMRRLRTKIATDAPLDDTMRQQLAQYDTNVAAFYNAYTDSLATFRQELQGPDAANADARADAKIKGKGLAASNTLGTFEQLLNAQTVAIRDQQRVDIHGTNIFLLLARLARFLLVAAVGVWLVRDVLRGFRTVEDAATAIGRGKRGVRIAVRGEDEIAQLGRAFNNMAAELSVKERRLEELRRIAIALTGATTEHDVCNIVVSRLAETFGYAYVSIYLLRPGDPENLHLISQRGYTTVIDPIPVPGTVTGRSVRERQPILVGDASNDPHFVAAEQQIVCEAVAPILAQDRVLGAVLLEEERVRGLTEEDLSLITTLANNIGVALENVRLTGEAQGRITDLATANRDLSAVTATGTRLAATLDPDSAVELVAAELASVTNAPSIYIALYDIATGLVTIRVAQADGARVPAPPIALDDSFSGWLIRSGTPVMLSSREEVDRFVAESGIIARIRHPGSMIGVPLVAGNDVIGAFSFSNPAPGAFSAQQFAVVKTIAAQAAISIRNGQLYNEVQRHAAEMQNLNAELAQANDLKSEFLATMSHELRTPLNAIIGFSELLSDGVVDDPEAVHDCLTDILNSGRHLLSLINDILDISKIEAGKMELRRETFDIRTEIAEAARLVHPLVTARNQVFTMQEPPAPVWVFADRQRIRQVLLNLLSNAIKFTPDGGGVTVRCDTNSIGLNGPEIRITVADTGIGIKREDFEIIFEKFRQVDSSFARRYEGTGLGLALTKQLVELNGGEIAFTSVYGAGSTFSFTIPQAPAPTTLIASPALVHAK